MAKISSDVSVNECQSNNIKDITSLMIDRIRKKQGLCQINDYCLVFFCLRSIKSDLKIGSTGPGARQQVITQPVI